MSSSAESSFLLWSLGALIAVLGAFVTLGWVRQSHHLAGGRRWLGALVCSAIFATAFSMASELGLSGEALSFPLGFRTLWVLTLWLGSLALAYPVFVWLVFKPGLVSCVGAGFLLAGVSTFIHVMWVVAAGFRPGINWRWEFVAFGGMVMAAGFGTACMLAFPQEVRRQRRLSRRVGAAVMMGLSSLGGHALVLIGAGLQTQVGSIFRKELSGSLLSLIGGGLVPMVLALLAVDLELRRQERKTQRRSRRSHRYPDGEPRSARPRPALAEMVPVAAVAAAAASQAAVADEVDDRPDLFPGAPAETASTQETPAATPIAAATALNQPQG
jgi:hypothetical protein